MSSEEEKTLLGDGGMPSDAGYSSLDDGERRLAQVRAYMRLVGTDETARLAAAMAPKTETFDPATLIDRALRLETEVEAGLVRRRQAMVAHMDHLGLRILLKKLGVKNNPKDSDFNNAEWLSDPIVAPVLIEYHRKAPISCLARLKEYISIRLSLADRNTELPRPSLPCSLEEAWRYAANAPEATRGALEKAYAKCPSEWIIPGPNDEGLSPLKGPLPPSSSTDQEARKLYREEQRTNASLCGGGTSSAEPADLIPNNNNDKVRTELDLADIVFPFHYYWKKHGEEYEQRERRSKETGSAGPSTRDQELWKKRTKDFMASDDFKIFLKRSSQSLELFTYAVNAFLEAYDAKGSKSPPAKKKVKEFLLSLFAYKSIKMSDSKLEEFRERMRKHSVFAISDDVIRKCRDRLNAGLYSGDRSDS